MCPMTGPDYAKTQALIRTLRSDFIDQAVEIESVLDNVLAAIIAGSAGDAARTTIIREAVVRNQAMTFGIKINMLKSLSELVPGIRINRIVRRLDNVRRRRNLLAHGSWIYVSTTDALLEYEENGQSRSVRIDAQVSGKWLNHAYDALGDLWPVWVAADPSVAEE